MPDWDRVKLIFAEIVDAPVDQQPRLLGQLCRDDADLRAAVEKLLEAHASAGTFLESPTLGHTAIGDAPSEAQAGGGLTEPESEQIGPFTLLGVVGEGGFGTVYRAQQESPVRRIVALKLLKLGMDTRQIIRRFEAERQLLALMDHPNIASVLDAGATPASGRPYFVMELVDGAPITHFCDEHRLGVGQRIELMIDVCNAVQHAHQKGIIHRDLKPSNVLVAFRDGRAFPKIIDFGVAKAIDPHLSGQSLMTEANHLIGTPAYMSPEQAGLCSSDVDTRSDIYSLGVLLFEMATGLLPFGRKTLLPATLDDFRRQLREADPPRPSTRISRLARAQGEAGEYGTEAREIASRRSTSPRALHRRLRGDLDWIIIKCLQRDRERRYPSASDLARDLRRLLDDEPVLAGPPGAAYRLRKFVRRHRVALLSSLAVLVALLAGLGLAISGFVAANAARETAELQKARAVESAGRAQREANRAQAVSAFLQEMLASANPRKRPGGADVSVRQILREAADSLRDGAFSGQPETQAAIRLVVGAGLRDLGLYAEAEPQLAGALALQRRTYGPRSREYAAALVELGELEALRGSPKAAERLFRQSLEINQAVRAQDDPVIAVNLSDLATTLYSQQRLDEAVALYEQALALLRKAATPDAAALSDALNNLGLTLAALGRLDEAERCYRDALELGRERHGDKHPAIATNLDNLAGILAVTNRLDEAERMYRKALAMRRALLGNLHPDVAVSLHNLARLLFYAGASPEETESLLQESLDIMMRVHGLAHLDTLTVLDSLVSVEGALGKLDEAERLLLQAFTAVEGADAVPPERRAALARRLAELYRALGRPDDAEAWSRKAATATTRPATAGTSPVQ